MPHFSIVPGVEWPHRPESACFSSFPPEISTNISVRNVGPPPGQRPRTLKNPFTLSLHNLHHPEQGSCYKASSPKFTELGHVQEPTRRPLSIREPKTSHNIAISGWLGAALNIKAWERTDVHWSHMRGRCRYRDDQAASESGSHNSNEGTVTESASGEFPLQSASQEYCLGWGRGVFRPHGLALPQTVP